MKKDLLLFSVVALLAVGCTAENLYMKTAVNKEAHQLQKYTIAVLPENFEYKDTHCYESGSFVNRAIITELNDLGFTVIERTQYAKILDAFYDNIIKYTGIEDHKEDTVQKTEDKSGQTKIVVTQINNGAMENKTSMYEILMKDRDYDILERNTAKDIGHMIGADALLITRYWFNSNSTIRRGVLSLVEVETGKVLLNTTFINDGENPVQIRKFLSTFETQMKKILDGKQTVISEYAVRYDSTTK